MHTFCGAKTFEADATISASSASAFQVQDATSNRVLGVDTSAGSVLIGQGSTVNGELVVSNSTNNNTVTIASGATTTSYTLTLPTDVGSANQCLANSGTPGVLTWAACSGGGGGGGTQEVRLVPEFAGGTLTADGTDNSGVMSADYDGTARRNYYQWTSSQVTNQDYDIVVNAQVPSDYTGNFANLTIDTWRDNNTDGSATYNIVKRDGTACGSGTLTFSGTVSTWASSAITVTCTPAAGEVLIVQVKTVSANNANVRIGDISFNYDN